MLSALLQRRKNECKKSRSDDDHKNANENSTVQYSTVTIFMSRASLIIQDYDGCAHA